MSPRMRPRTPAERRRSTSARTPRGPTRRSTTRTSTGAGASWRSSSPIGTLGAYANGNADAGPEETRRIYGDAKVARLAALKRDWDPDNVFHVNPNVAPAES